ncbi:MFS family permease [Brevibacillus aydinogluensis]|nr:MFS family permease [Brevibacillus aydinogluensis]
MNQTDGTLPKDLVRVALVLVFGAVAPMLDTTMVNIAVNHFSRDFQTSLETVQWVMTGYVLALAIAVPFSGWLVQRFEGKSVYFIAELLFLLSSLLAGLSWNIESLIAFRIVQGFAAGLIIPLLTTLLVQAAGQDQMGRLMAIVGLPIILGPILGPVAGGLLVEYASWRWIFYINVPIGIIALALIYMKMPRFPATNRRAALDWTGILLLGGLSASFIYGISRGAEGGSFGGGASIGFIALGVILTIAYIVYALVRSSAVIVPLSLFRYKTSPGPSSPCSWPVSGRTAPCCCCLCTFKMFGTTPSSPPRSRSFRKVRACCSPDPLLGCSPTGSEPGLLSWPLRRLRSREPFRSSFSRRTFLIGRSALHCLFGESVSAASRFR